MSALTKREQFAMAAMQGLLSNLAEIRKEGFKDAEIDLFAVIRADALLAALAKDSPAPALSLAEWNQLNDIRNAALRVVSSRRSGVVADVRALDALEKALEARP